MGQSKMPITKKKEIIINEGVHNENKNKNTHTHIYIHIFSQWDELECTQGAHCYNGYFIFNIDFNMFLILIERCPLEYYIF